MVPNRACHGTLQRKGTLSTCKLAPDTAVSPVLQIAVGSDLDAGKIEAYRIDREGLHSHKAYFHHFMDQPTQRLCDLALKMFDRHGHLKPQLYGTFGPETNPGALLYIRGVTLKQKYRRQGIGNAALSQLLQQLNSQYSAKAPWHFAGTPLQLQHATAV